MFEKLKNHQNILIVCFVILFLVFLYYKSTENFGNNNDVYLLWEAKNATINKSLLKNKIPQNLLDSNLIANATKIEKNIALDTRVNTVYNLIATKSYKTFVNINIPANNSVKKSAKFLIKINDLLNRTDSAVSGVALATKSFTYSSNKESIMNFTHTLNTRAGSMHNLFITIQLIDGDITALPDKINATVRVEEVTK